MAPGSNRSVFCAAVFLLAATVLVHAMDATRPALSQRPPSKARPAREVGNPVGYGTIGLPAPVVEMREAILAAAHSGQLEDLRTAIELNEIKPVIADTGVGDPIAHLKALSADGEGRDVLVALSAILEAGWVALPLGRDLENNRVYVWPHFVETGVRGLSPERAAELSRLVAPAEVAAMQVAGRYGSWRIGIGADGVWHFLTK